MPETSIDFIIMDQIDNERSQCLSPHQCESSTTQNCFDLECSFSQQDYLRQMSHFTTNIEAIGNNFYQTESDEPESDAPDQHPIEATDESTDLSQTTVVTSEAVEDSFSHTTSEEHSIDTLPNSEEIKAIAESSATESSDTETITTPTSVRRPVFNYSLSRCVPCSNDQEEVAIQEQYLTTCASEFTSVDIKKEKNDLAHIMISYNHSTKIICVRIAKALRNRGYIVWIDQDNITGDVFTSMASAIENSFVVLMAINEEYSKSRYCRLEAEYSVEINKASIPMMMQRDYRPSGWLGIINGSKFQIDFSRFPFNEAFGLLIREIEAVRFGLGADHRDQPVPMSTTESLVTTMDTTSSRSRDLHEWTERDVIDWLHRNKLEVFEDSLRNFTGETLRQLHTVKSNSPPDYYRMVESLLPTTVFSRLFHNLTFHGALESLFSSSSTFGH